MTTNFLPTIITTTTVIPIAVLTIVTITVLFNLSFMSLWQQVVTAAVVGAADGVDKGIIIIVLIL